MSAVTVAITDTAYWKADGALQLTVIIKSI